MIEFVFTHRKNGMQIYHLSDIPAGDHPMEHDIISMGQRLGENVFILFEKFPHQHMNYLKIYDLSTGEVVKIDFPPKS